MRQSSLSIRQLVVTFALIGSIFTVDRLTAQDAAISIEVEDISEVQELKRRMMLEMARTAGESPDEGEGDEANKEDQQAQMLLEMYMDIEIIRTPGQTLSAMASQEKGEPKPDPEDEPKFEGPNAQERRARYEESKKAQQFRMRVVSGDWDAVAERLAAMPEKVGPQVYQRLLQALMENNASMLPHDVLALADAVPGEPTAQHVQALGRLLMMSTAVTGSPRDMLARMNAGTKRFGGKDPANRQRAAQILLAAHMIEEAHTFLPPLETARKDNNATLVNLHALYRQTVGKKKSDENLLYEAWNLSREVLDIKDVDEKEKAQAQSRLLALLNDVPAAVGSKWLDLVFREDRATGLKLMGQIVTQLERLRESPDTSGRAEQLKTINRLAEELLTAAGDDVETWRTPLELLAMAWMHEAQHTVVNGGNENDNDYDSMRRREMMMRSSGGIFASPDMSFSPFGRGGGGDYPAIPAAELLPSRPTPRWRAAINLDVARKTRTLTANLFAQAGQFDDAFPIIEELARDDENKNTVIELMGQYIQAWVNRLDQRSSNDYGGSYNPYGYPGSYSPYGYSPYGYNRYGSSGIPLTRAQQVRNLKQLRGLVDTLSQLPFDEWKGQPLVSAFGQCHSSAEVYRKEDIEAIFGAIDTMDKNAVTSLVGDMRQKLARLWRSAQVQDQANTKRTDRETAEQVNRGYDLAFQLAEAAIANEPDDWSLRMMQASLFFDKGEFLYGQKVDLETYADLRDRAFKAYEKAAGLYVQSLHTDTKPGEEKQLSAQVFSQWFQSAMGASDLSYLTRTDAPDYDQIAVIEQTIDRMHGDWPTEHRGLFAQQLVGSMYSLNPELKPRYLRHALRIIGDHKDGEDARKLLAFYDDLLGEVELQMAIDGSSDVGHQRRFGVHLSIAHTATLGREAGGFGKYLQKQYYVQSTGAQIDMQEKIEESIRPALEEGFEFESILFHDPKVKPISYGRSGWQKTPMAYIVLRAKDPSVDRIPSVQFDLEFNDGNGVVLLPINSQVVLVDAREADPDPRPVRDVEIEQTLDNRSAETNKLKLEIRATGKGILPRLGQLLAVEGNTIGEFKVINVVDHGLSPDQFDPEAEQPVVISTRSWTIELEATPDAVRSASFTFPDVRIEPTKIIYRTYDDADIIDTEQTVALTGLGSSGQSWWYTLFGALAVLAMAAVTIYAYRKDKREQQQAAVPRYGKPQQVTPFTAMTLLKRMEADRALALTASDQESLRGDLIDLEERYFASRDANGQNGDVERIVDRWLERAGGTPS